eukprot:snap_masked-scaffold_25-processed-gene-3.9-mRNA-1 protein AED:1.00 eAED:1.00 QI:0/-1/0/0/-1/1/1/0/342
MSVQKHKSISNLDLGVKKSVTAKIWQESEMKSHRNSLKIISSPVKKELDQHEKYHRRASVMLQFGQRNKEASLKLGLKKIKKENANLVNRLKSLEGTNKQEKKKEKIRARYLKNKSKFQKQVKVLQKKGLLNENRRIYRRITDAKGSLTKRKEHFKQFKQHEKAKRNMCRLQVPNFSSIQSKSSVGSKKVKSIRRKSVSDVKQTTSFSFHEDSKVLKSELPQDRGQMTQGFGIFRLKDAETGQHINKKIMLTVFNRRHNKTILIEAKSFDEKDFLRFLEVQYKNVKQVVLNKIEVWEKFNALEELKVDHEVFPVKLNLALIDLVKENICFLGPENKLIWMFA